MKFLKVTSLFGKILSCIIILFLISIIMVSFSISKEKNTNPFCKNININNVEFEYEQIIKYDYEYDCSTIYFYLVVNDNVSKDNCVSLAVDICKQIQDLDCFTHFEINGALIKKTLYLSVDLKTLQVSYVGE